jgi:glycerol-3-phosphate dehydrogenase
MQTDVLVIGGGATGGGIAWDLALRGVRVVLAEMGDLATGTSGRYHGLLHSGGRYAVRDPESAKECIDENLTLRKIAAQAIEDTGGYFVLCPGDEDSYESKWLRACADVNIPTRKVSLAEALKREPVLNPKLRAIYEVPDGTCDSWDLLHMLQAGATGAGATFLTYHRVESFHREGDRIVGARLINLRDNSPVDISCAVIVNAAGPWAWQVGEKAGVKFSMKLSRGAMLAYNIRWVNTVINKLRAPGDGDIFVPVGTVSVIGTTSVRTDDPADTRVEAWEVARILEEAEAMTPGISRARILRAWGGVRPLYDPGQQADGREAKRTFTTLDHEVTEGIAGFISIIGGKLTTYRLMAEKISDLVCSKLGVTTPCTTAETPLPPMHGENKLHRLRGRLDTLEHGENPGALVCECEIVTETQIIEALSQGDVVTLNDLRRDLRLGMGPCQGGFCSYRAAGIRHEFLRDTPTHTRDLLAEFVERRFGGMKALLWGHNLRQALLAEHIYGRIVGLTSQPDVHHDTPDWSNVKSLAPAQADVGTPYRASALSDAQLRVPTTVSNKQRVRARITVVGAGLAGLMAGLAAAEAGARVELIAQGQGALVLHPGWIETGDVDSLASSPTHPYARVHGALAAGLALLDQIMPLETSHIPGVPLRAILGMGTLRSVAFGGGIGLRAFTQGDKILVVGIEVEGTDQFKAERGVDAGAIHTNRDERARPVPGGAGWRDFYPRLIADTLRANGFEADAVYVELPHRGGNFDDWSVDIANSLDTDEGLKRLADQVKPQLSGADIAAFPAVLGFKAETRGKLSQLLGVPVMEIPTLTPSIPGLRMYHTLRRALLDRGGRVTIGPRAVGLQYNGAGAVTGVLAATAANGRPRVIPADAVILATGGLYGGGLESEYTGLVRETVVSSPVSGVPPISDWFSHPLLDGQPQPIHFAGILTDDALRPLRVDGQPQAPNLHIAGRSLAGYSPISQGCTEGVDIASGVHAALAALAEVSMYAAGD